MSEVDQFLEHHGVKGQKWGIRNKKKQVFTDKQKTTFKKAPAKLSDEELNRRIRRMQMERQYTDLNKTKADSGAAFAKSLHGQDGHDHCKHGCYWTGDVRNQEGPREEDWHHTRITQEAI